MLKHALHPSNFQRIRLKLAAEDYARSLNALQPPQGKSSPSGELAAYFHNNDERWGIWKWNHYFPIYEAILAPFRGEDVHLMEIGIYSGGSLNMWREFLGHQTHILGVDIEPTCAVYTSPGVDVLIGDQSDREFWRRELPRLSPLHIVVDDGGHLAHQQIPSFEEIFPYLAPGGIYICEDLHQADNGFVAYLQGLSHQLNSSKISPARSPYTTSGPVSGIAKWVSSIHFYPFMAVINRTMEPPREWTSEKHGNSWEPHL